MKSTIIIFQSSLFDIGGVETFTYNMCHQLNKIYDVTLLYNHCSEKQRVRFSNIVKLSKYTKKKAYIADIIIIATSWGIQPTTLLSKKGEYWQMIHADYKEILKINPNFKFEKFERTTKYIAVSKRVKDSFLKVYKKKCDLMYNILLPDPPLRLISATRLSKEKGYDRMVILAHMLKEAGVNFHWKIFTNRDLYKIEDIDMPEIEYCKSTFDIFGHIREADYGVQLSDTEGFSYFIQECLQQNTPIICTNFPSAYESVVDGENGYICNMEMDNIDIKRLINHIPSFKFKANNTIDDWKIKIEKALLKPDKKPCNLPEKVVCMISYRDVKLDRTIKIGEALVVSGVRALLLREKGFCI